MDEEENLSRPVAEVGGRRSEVRGRRSEVGGQIAEVKSL